MRKSKEKGITLIALVVTIIVLIILAGVTISALSGQNGILKRVAEVAEQEAISSAEEKIKLAILEYYTSNSTYTTEEVLAVAKEAAGSDSTITDRGETITVTTSDGNTIDITNEIGGSMNYEGCFADVDGDGTPDGIIFADLAYSEEGDWGVITGNYDTLSTEHNEYYKWNAIDSSELKSYEINKDCYTYENDVYGKHIVIAETKDTEGEDRFYVIAFEDLKVGDYTTFYWYYNAYGNLDTSITAKGFGEGKTNTEIMISAWNEQKYGYGVDDDLWGEIQKNEKYQKGWFVPSCGELAAALTNIGVDKTNYINYNFSSKYVWTSSTHLTSGACLIHLSAGQIGYGNSVTNPFAVRLVTTF